MSENIWTIGRWQKSRTVLWRKEKNPFGSHCRCEAFNYEENLLHWRDDGGALTEAGESDVVTHITFRKLYQRVWVKVAALRMKGLKVWRRRQSFWYEFYFTGIFLPITHWRHSYSLHAVELPLTILVISLQAGRWWWLAMRKQWRTALKPWLCPILFLEQRAEQRARWRVFWGPREVE